MYLLSFVAGGLLTDISGPAAKVLTWWECCEFWDVTRGDGGIDGGAGKAEVGGDSKPWVGFGDCLEPPLIFLKKPAMEKIRVRRETKDGRWCSVKSHLTLQINVRKIT